MSFQKFAVAVTLPGAPVHDLVKAAVAHSVHIIDKHEYDAAKDYIALNASQQPYDGEDRVKLMFVYDNGASIMADDEERLREALARTGSY